MNKSTFKRYAISTLVTFTTGFLAVIATQIDTISLETIQSGMLLGIIASAIRAGVKATIEHIMRTSGDVLSTQIDSDTVTSTFDLEK